MSSRVSFRAHTKKNLTLSDLSDVVTQIVPSEEACTPTYCYNICFMISESKSRKIGNSLGAILPKEVTIRLNIEEGTTLYFTEAPDGVRITAHNPEFARKMAAADSLSRRYRNALRELGK